MQPQTVSPGTQHCLRLLPPPACLPCLPRLPACLPLLPACLPSCLQILEGILPKEVPRGAPPPDKKLLEHHFVFACVWAFGGCMLVDKVSDYRTQFSRWWQGEHKAVVFPTEVRAVC